MASMIYVNDVPIPYPARGLEIMVATLVDSARNANGTVVGQKIGRDQYKINALTWPWLTAAQWSMILRLFSGFYATVRFPDPVSGGWKTLKMYPGDRAAEPYWVGGDGLPTHYTNCRVNIIDVGE
jgi:hypothetical protein